MLFHDRLGGVRYIGTLFATLLFAAGAGVVAVATPAQATVAAHSEQLLFDGGGESLNGVTYHSFRIPSLLRTTSNTLLAFAEGRVTANADYGNINLVYKRSTDNGTSWSGLMQVVGAGQGTWGNPTGVVDQSTGRIWLFMSWNPAGYSQNGTGGTVKISQWGDRRVYVSDSDDDGLTWTAPLDLTGTLTPRTHADGSIWSWDAVGPGVGIQETGGRLVIPALNRDIYSDDHGTTWSVAPLADSRTSESTVLQLLDGRLMRNDRAYGSTWETAKRRWVARGTIEGGFDDFAPDNTLLDPPAEGSILRYNTTSPARIVFLNSASTVTRTKMTVRISYDEARTWPVHRALSDAPLPAWSGLGTGAVAEGGYSSMAKTADYCVGALVEVNEDTASGTSHRSIVFRKVNLPWILDGATEPTGGTQ
jgi:sialidase-1